MIATWMLSALLFVALAAAATWPVIAPFARLFLPGDGSALSIAMLATIQVVPDQLPATIA